MVLVPALRTLSAFSFLPRFPTAAKMLTTSTTCVERLSVCASTCFNLQPQRALRHYCLTADNEMDLLPDNNENETENMTSLVSSGVSTVKNSDSDKDCGFVMPEEELGSPCVIKVRACACVR